MNTDSLRKRANFTNRFLIELNWSRPQANGEKHLKESHHAFKLLVSDYAIRLFFLLLNLMILLISVPL